jgi:hypothetical protein
MTTTGPFLVVGAGVVWFILCLVAGVALGRLVHWLAYTVFLIITAYRQAKKDL